MKGFYVGSAMFLSTIFLKIIEYSDRYFITYFINEKELGIYFFFFQIANLVNVIVYTAFISFVYPSIMKSVYSQSQKTLQIAQNSIIKNTIALTILFAVLSLFFMNDLLDFIDRPELYEKRSVFYIHLAGAFFFNLSFASHFVLIAEEKEKLILKVTLASCIVNVVLNLSLIPVIGIYGAAISLLCSNIIMFIIKLIYEKRLISKWVAT